MGPSKPPAPPPADEGGKKPVVTLGPTDEWTDDPSTVDGPETVIDSSDFEPASKKGPAAPGAPRPVPRNAKVAQSKPPPVPVRAARAPSSPVIRASHPGDAPAAAAPPAKAPARGGSAQLTSDLRAGSPMPATFAKYELLMPVARGGMASVWTARMRGAHGFTRTVAIKVLRPDLAESPDFRTMFLDEARVSAMVHHPNVADVLDFGEDRGVLYIVMEWVEGESVARLRKAAKAMGGIPLRISLRMAADAAAGLHAAHELCDDRGEPIELVHRDVSPSNILVSRQGFVKLIDFGVAKSNARAYQTSGGPALKGKAAYLSPEQVSGKPLDRRSDIFSFGTMLYSLTTGRHPFRADTLLKTAENVGLASPVRPRDVIPSMPVALEAIILKALEPDPAKRFATALELQTALRKVLSAIGNPTSLEVAAFVESVLGAHLTKRAAKLRATIAAFDEAEEIRRGALQAATEDPAVDAAAEEPLWHDEEEATPPAEELPAIGTAAKPESTASASRPPPEPATSEQTEPGKEDVAAAMESPLLVTEATPPAVEQLTDFDTAAESELLRPRRRTTAVVLFAAALLAGGVLAFLFGPAEAPAPSAGKPPIAQSTTIIQTKQPEPEVMRAPPPPPLPPPPASVESPPPPAPPPQPVEPVGTAAAAAPPPAPPAPVRAAQPRPWPPAVARPVQPEAPESPRAAPASTKQGGKFNPRGI